MIKAILWDIDGTLLLSEPLHFESIKHVANTLCGIDIEPEYHERLLGKTIDETFQLLHKEKNIPLTKLEWVKHKYHYYITHSHTIPPRDDALETWEKLDSMGIKQALVSNSDRVVVTANIAAMKLIQPKLVSVTRNDVLNGKPDAEPYLRASFLLGIPPEECCVIEDSPIGAQAGIAAGMKTFGWPEDKTLTFPKSVTVIQYISEIFDYIQ